MLYNAAGIVLVVLTVIFIVFREIRYEKKNAKKVEDHKIFISALIDLDISNQARIIELEAENNNLANALDVAERKQIYKKGV